MTRNIKVFCMKQINTRLSYVAMRHTGKNYFLLCSKESIVDALP